MHIDSRKWRLKVTSIHLIENKKKIVKKKFFSNSKKRTRCEITKAFKCKMVLVI